MSKLGERFRDLQSAKAALVDELSRTFPFGSRVVYRLRETAPEQIGEVVGYVIERPGFLRIKLARARFDRGEENRFITSLPFTKIVGKA